MQDFRVRAAGIKQKVASFPASNSDYLLVRFEAFNCVQLCELNSTAILVHQLVVKWMRADVFGYGAEVGIFGGGYRESQNGRGVVGDISSIEDRRVIKRLHGAIAGKDCPWENGTKYAINLSASVSGVPIVSWKRLQKLMQSIEHGGEFGFTYPNTVRGEGIADRDRGGSIIIDMVLPEASEVKVTDDKKGLESRSKIAIRNIGTKC